MAKQAPLTTSKMFNAHWTERDEAVLVDLLHRKINELRWEMRQAESPYVRARLKNMRAEYKKLLKKVESGDYDPNILAAEMQSHAAYNSLQREKREKAVGRYADAYSDIDFDFESYFKKTRYFGAACPLIMIILIVVLVAVMLCSSFLSTQTICDIEDAISGESRLSLTSIGFFKLGDGALDFQVPNDGNWPAGTFQNPNEAYERGEQYVNKVTSQVPETVWLYRDLGMISIDITIFDVIKGLFRTPMLSENRIDFIEDLDQLQGTSWYYQRYMRDRADSIKIEKDENGHYDGLKIVKHIATYGTIVFLILGLLLCIIELIINLGRLFSYTSRRIHVIPVFILLCFLISFLCPVFLDLTELTGDSVSEAFTNYFTMYWSDFVNTESMMVCVNMLYIILLVIPLLLIILPLIFHNRSEKAISYVPKGNKAHTYAGQSSPTKAGQPGDRRALGKTKGKVAKAGSRSPTNSRTPRR